MHQNQNITAKEKKYKGFPFRQRLVPAILVSLAISLTVFVFGPFEIYSANADQFGFSLFDFLGWNLLFALGVSAIICAILLPLRGRVFDIVFALFFWLALMLMVQGGIIGGSVAGVTDHLTGYTANDLRDKVVNSVKSWKADLDQKREQRRQEQAAQDTDEVIA